MTYEPWMWTFLTATLLMTGIIIYGVMTGQYQKRKKFNLFWLSRYMAPALIVVLVSKVFIADWSYVPTASMWPSVAPRELVFLTKYDYNVFAEPYLKQRIFEVAPAQRGDVITFLYPLDESVTYLKRVVAVGGDTVEYDSQKKLTVTTQEKQVINYSYSNPQLMLWTIPYTIATESIENKTYKTARALSSTALAAWEFNNFKNFQGCDYKTTGGFRCHVPANAYFVMGDNRDQSLDSRYWGFVPANKVLGHARYACSVNALKTPKFQCRAL